MDEVEQAGICVFFCALEEPGVERTQRQNRIDIVVVSALGVICGAESWGEIADSGRATGGSVPPECATRLC